MELQIKIAGVFMLVLSLLHLVFPSYFKWKDDLLPLRHINRQLMYVHTFFIGLTVLLMGALCLVAASDLLHTRLGTMICFGLFIFWFVRLLFQFFVYSSLHWKGRRFETCIHIIFSALWIYFSAVFLIATLYH